MSMKALAYSIRQGLKSIGRNRMFSLASLGTMIACLFMLGVFLTILINFHHIVDSAESTVTISVYFKKDIQQNRLQRLEKISVPERKWHRQSTNLQMKHGQNFPRNIMRTMRTWWQALGMTIHWEIPILMW